MTIYLDNAATSYPKPQIVYDFTNDFFRNKTANPGRGNHKLARDSEDIINQTRKKLANFFNVPDMNQIIYTYNTTDALNLGIKGILKKGDHVITTSIEHNSVLRPLFKLKNLGIIDFTIVCSDNKGLVDPKKIEKSIQSNTKLIIVNHASNVFGTVQKISEISKIAKKHNIIFMVDAAQTAGLIEIDVTKDNIHLLAFAGHKSLLGAPGVGGLYISPNIELDTFREGGTGIKSILTTQPPELPTKYESGTLNVIGIASLNAALDFINTHGINNIYKHEMSLINYCYEKLKEIPEIIVYGAFGDDNIQKVPVLSFNFKKFDSLEAVTILDQDFDIAIRFGLHCAALAHDVINTSHIGTLRVSPGFFNTFEHIDTLIKGIKSIISEFKLNKIS